MSLREARVLFTIYLAQLILYAFDLGYEVALGESADFITAKDPTSDHMKGSLHSMGLAADLALYRDGVYLTKTEEYAELGDKWKNLHPYCRWGGSFSDGNHFSFAPPEHVGNRA